MKPLENTAKESYYDILKKVVDSVCKFNKIKKTYEKLPIFYHPLPLIEVTCLGRNPAKANRLLLFEISNSKIPYLAFKRGHTLLFVNLRPEYKEIIKNFNMAKYRNEEKRLFGITAVYNYNIFGADWLDIDNIILVWDTHLRLMCEVFKIDYVLEVHNFWLVRENIGVGYAVKMKKKKFILRNIFLSHQIYDERDKITASFLLSFARIVRKTVKVLKSEIRLNNPVVFKTKQEIIRYFVINFIEPYCNAKSIKIPSLEYENPDAALKVMDKFLDFLKQNSS